jgi:peptidoglycan/LPS O-acetylase OafA/YrhL
MSPPNVIADETLLPAFVPSALDPVDPSVLFPDRIPSLDGLRAVAIINVLVGHVSLESASYAAIMSKPALNWLRALLTWSIDPASGVRLFFALSGFLITWLLLVEEHRKTRISLRLFYFRRALRILPVYYSYLFVAALICAFSSLPLATPSMFLHAATFTMGWWPDMHALLGHTWSLSVEETFYLLWPPLLCQFKGPRRWIIAWTVIAATPIVRIALYRSGQQRLLDHSAIGTADAIMWGCLAAMVLWRWPDRVQHFVASRSTTGRLLALVLIFIPVAWGWNFHHPELLQLQKAFRPFMVPMLVTIQAVAFCYLIWSLSLYRRGIMFWLLNTRAMIATGVLSYSFYLWQEIFLMHEIPYAEGWWQRFPQNLPLAMMTAIASYVLIERPILRLKDRFKVTRAQPHLVNTAVSGNITENVLP